MVCAGGAESKWKSIPSSGKHSTVEADSAAQEDKVSGTNAFQINAELKMNGRRDDQYHPVSPKAFDQSELDYAAEYRSRGFSSMLPNYREARATIIYLHSSAKLMYLAYQGCGMQVGPSEVFAGVSRDHLELLDAAIADTPNDLLILTCRNPRDFDLDDHEEALRNAAEIQNDDHHHSLHRYHGRLLIEHLSSGGRARLLAFRRAMAALDDIDLFHEGGVGPLALDFFPSLFARADELVARDEALAWRPEEDGNRVVTL
jgi:hypothetical protein